MANDGSSTSSNDTMNASEEKPIFEVADLAVSFDNGSGPRIQAVNGVKMSVYPNQTLAVVGESGCGKSVTAMSAMQLIPRPPGRFDGGSILFEGRDLLTLSEREMRSVRGRDIAMIFQEPMTSLNPVFKIGDQIMEAVLLHQNVSRTDAEAIAIKSMEDVGIEDAVKRFRQYPHQFSGGMRQRVLIAMALSCEPALLIADEPTTALDVTVQAQVLELLAGLQQEMEMAVLLVTHDLGVVAETCERVISMYAGEIVEQALAEQLFRRPSHPYTAALLECLPGLRPDEPLVPIPGVVPARHELPSGCLYGPRCYHAVSQCSAEHPELSVAGSRQVRCFRADDLELPGVGA